MTIEEGLKSDDIEVLALYCNIALKKEFSLFVIKSLLNKNYIIFKSITGNYYLNDINLNYTEIKI